MNDAHHTTGTTEARSSRFRRRLSLLAAGALLSLSVAASPALGQDTTGGEASAKQNVQQSTSEQGSSGQSSSEEDSSGSGQQAGAKGADCELLEDFETSPMEDSYGDDLNKEIDQLHECVGGSQSSAGGIGPDSSDDESGDGESGDSSSDSSGQSQYDDEGEPSGAGAAQGSGGGSSEGSPESGEQYDATATVERAVDGDTLQLQEPVEGHDTVRLIGVDTPELNASEEDADPEPYAEDASEFTASELEGEEVSLEFGQEKTDDYDRLLAYVYTDHEEGKASDSSGNGSSKGSSESGESSTTSEDGPEMFNETLLREGYGEVLTIEPNSEYEQRFEDAEAAARDEGKGIWSEGESSDASSSDSSSDSGPRANGAR